MMYTYLMNYEKVLFDLDGTLYPNKIGLWNEIANKIYIFMHEKLDINLDEVPSKREYYFKTYGTTLRGLQHDYPNMDTEEYLDFIHRVNIQDHIDPNPQLKQQLEELTLEKWIFTNADKQHALRVTDLLGIQDQFSGIIDVRTMNFRAKPDIQAYQYAFDASKTKPSNAIFLDDQDRNLEPANQLGLYTIHITEKTHKKCLANACFPTINNALTHIQKINS